MGNSPAKEQEITKQVVSQINHEYYPDQESQTPILLIPRSLKEQPCSKYDDQKGIAKIRLQSAGERQMKLNPVHQNIGLLFCHTANRSPIMQPIQGTGFLISPNLVLTVAHNVYSPKRSDYPSLQVEFYPGLNGKVGKYFKSTTFLYPDQYFPKKSWNQYDFALIKLPEDVEMAEVYLCPHFDKLNQDLLVFGYPDRDNFKYNLDGSIDEAYQKGLLGKGPKDIKDMQMTYEITTKHGMSGCPLVTGITKNQIIGIHRGSDENPQHEWNSGLCITIQMILLLQIFRERMGGKAFRVFDQQAGGQLDLSSRVISDLKDILIKFQRSNQSLQIEYKRQKIAFNERQNYYEDKIRQYKTDLGVNFAGMMEQNKELRQKLDRAIVKKNQFRQISEKRFKTLAEKDFQIQNLKDQVQTLRIHSADNHPTRFIFAWNEQSENISSFLVEKKKITLLSSDQEMHLIRSLYPLPRQRVSTIRFKVHRMRGKHPISIGIISSVYKSGCKNTIFYDSMAKNDKSSGQLAFQSLEERQKREDLHHDEIIIDVEVDLKANAIRFNNLLKKKEARPNLSEVYRTGDIYVACQMRNKDDCIEVLQ